MKYIKLSLSLLMVAILACHIEVKGQSRLLDSIYNYEVIHLNASLDLKRSRDGGYSYVFYKSNVVIADLHFSNDSNLIYSYTAMSPVISTAVYDSTFEYEKVFVGSSFANGDIVNYEYLNWPKDIGIRREFTADIGNSVLYKEENDSSISYSFWQNESDSLLVGYETDLEGKLISKTMFKRLSELEMSSDVRLKFIRAGVKYLPITKYSYQNGVITYVYTYKNGEVVNKKKL